jgi:hypothetical protein
MKLRDWLVIAASSAGYAVGLWSGRSDVFFAAAALAMSAVNVAVAFLGDYLERRKSQKQKLKETGAMSCR